MFKAGWWQLSAVSEGFDPQVPSNDRLLEKVALKSPELRYSSYLVTIIVLF